MYLWSCRVPKAYFIVIFRTCPRRVLLTSYCFWTEPTLIWHEPIQPKQRCFKVHYDLGCLCSFSLSMMVLCSFSLSMMVQNLKLELPLRDYKVPPYITDFILFLNHRGCVYMDKFHALKWVTWSSIIYLCAGPIHVYLIRCTNAYYIWVYIHTYQAIDNVALISMISEYDCV